MKTIKQIADEIGVSKQRVYRFIRKNRISDVHHDAGMMWCDEVTEKMILQHFNDFYHTGEAHQDVHQTTSLDTVIAMLQKELDMKNEQIKLLNERLSETTAALVVAQQSAQAAQLLHVGTMQKQLIEGGKSPNEPEAAQASFWRRLFGRRSEKTG
jgi:hypothetical protein